MDGLKSNRLLADHTFLGVITGSFIILSKGWMQLCLWSLHDRLTVFEIAPWQEIEFRSPEPLGWRSDTVHLPSCQGIVYWLCNVTFQSAKWEKRNETETVQWKQEHAHKWQKNPLLKQCWQWWKRKEASLHREYTCLLGRGDKVSFGVCLHISVL